LTEANILILGDNGTGKELVARELHRQSSRSEEVFISVDMGALSETLFESELFGHIRGAFTDARKDRAGRLEIASGGTLFLDEIGNIPLTLQAKLLTVLENRTVTRLGSNKTVEIQLPQLKDRLEDISFLAEHFLTIYCKKYNKPLKRMNSSTKKRLEKYAWPGNVRELQHAIERAVIMSESLVEKLVIHRAISKYSGNISHVAKELGLSRASLYRRLEKYGL